jgi:hypothetical protein
MKIIRKKIQELPSFETAEIISFLDTNFSTVFHEPNFNKIVSEVFNTEFSYGLVYNSVRKLIALCPLHSIKDGSLMKTYSNPAIYDVRYGGWVYSRNEVSLLELIKHMKLSANEALTYWSVPQIDNNDYISIKNKKEFQTGIIDLTLSLDDILHKYISRKRRGAIRSASRKGVIVEKLNPQNLKIFIEQCNFLKSSVGLKPFPSDFFVKLFNHYYAKKKIAAFASKLDDNYLASGVIIGNKKMMHLWVAGKPKEIFENVPRQDLLVWETIKWSKENGSKYFDLCVVESGRLPNIARFKLGFSKKIVPFYLYTKRNLAYRVISRLRRCF